MSNPSNSNSSSGSSIAVLDVPPLSTMKPGLLPSSKSKPKNLKGNMIHTVPWGKHLQDLPGTQRAITAAKYLQTKLHYKDRSFIKALPKSSVSGCFLLSFPVDFAKRFLRSQGDDNLAELVDENQERWPVEWAWRNSTALIVKGWRVFSTSYKLVEGDVLLVQFSSSPGGPRFKVSIFKRAASSRAGSKVAMPMRKIKLETVPDSEDEANEAEDEEGAEANEIVVTGKRARRMDAEKISVKLHLHEDRMKRLEVLLGESENQDVRGAVNRKGLEEVLKLMFPLEGAQC